MTTKIAITILLFLTSLLTFAQSEQADNLRDEGITLYDQGKYAEALDKYLESYKLDSNNIVLFSEMAMTYLELKDYENTERICQRAIEKFPDNRGLRYIYTTYGNCLDENQKPEEALKVYMMGINRFPDHAMLHFNKGVTEYSLKRDYDARTSFQTAITLNPNHPSSYYYLGIIENNFGNRIPAILALSRFLIIEPQGERAETILPFLTGMVNNMYYQVKTANSISTVSSAKIRTDTIASSFDKVEFGILTIETASSVLPDKGKQTELEKFETRSQTIFECLKAYKKENTGFYWDFLAPYFIAMVEKKYAKAFSCFINSKLNSNRDIEKWIKENQKEFKDFVLWNRDFRWGN